MKFISYLTIKKGEIKYYLNEIHIHCEHSCTLQGEGVENAVKENSCC